MIQFVCDSCGRIKADEEPWILGLAAESIGFQSARREINILSSWGAAQAVHPLAVHFCSARCKEKYMRRLFDPEAAAS